VEYLEIASDAEMQPMESVGGPVRVAAAVWVGRTRLIDNLRCQPPVRPNCNSVADGDLHLTAK